jgi:hypothetical protein
MKLTTLLTLLVLTTLPVISAGCIGPGDGSLVYEDSTTACHVHDYHWAAGFGSNYAWVTCTDKASIHDICSYQMGFDSGGHPNGSYYNCRSAKPQGTT